MASRTRVGLGPVFAYEWLMSSRRWQGYAMRSALVLFLLVGLALVWNDSAAGKSSMSIREQANVGRAFYGTTVMILLGLVGLAAPAATAGAICLDKARGNLTLLFTTDLSDPEIVLGKLAARLVPVLGLIACAAPVLALGTLFGGVDPIQLTGAILVCLACAVFGCALAMTFSVWGSKTHEVLLATYVFGILWLLAAPLWSEIRRWFPLWLTTVWMPSFEDLLRFNPIYLVIAPLDAPPGMRPVGLGMQATFFGLAMVASAVLVVIATLRLRAVVVRQAGQAERSSNAGRRGLSRWVPERWRRWLDRAATGRVPTPWPSPSIDANPVLWREWHRKRLSRWSVVVWGIFLILAGGFSLMGIVSAIDGSRPGRDMGAVANGMQVAAGLLLLSVSAATSLAEERQRGSLDVLMATPLSTRSIVWGKWWGAFRAVPWLAILPVMVASALIYQTSWFLPGVLLIFLLILAYGAAISSLGLALATWLPNMGRAVGLTVGLYVFVTIAAIPLAMLFFDDGPDGPGPGLAAASPFWGVGYYSAALAETAGGRADEILVSQTAWVFLWTILFGLTAAGLLIATMATFNRCLGRMDDLDDLAYDDDRPPLPVSPSHDGWTNRVSSPIPIKPGADPLISDH